MWLSSGQGDLGLAPEISPKGFCGLLTCSLFGQLQRTLGEDGKVAKVVEVEGEHDDYSEQWVRHKYVEWSNWDWRINATATSQSWLTQVIKEGNIGNNYNHK